MRSALVFATLSLAVATGCGPKVGPPPTKKIVQDPQALDRGRYLANHVAGCIACHSQRDLTKVGAPIVEGTEGAGGEVLTKKEHNAPGVIPTPNITPAALSAWSDGQIAYAFSAGVDANGDALFPIMPYPIWRNMAASDVDAIVLYLRSLEAKKSEDKERSLNFPLGIIVNTMPQEPTPQALPDPNDSVATGAYLAKMAGCHHCHSQEKRGVYKEGMEYAGGHDFKRGEHKIVAPNITPHEETGIGSWSKEAFIARFAAFRDPAVVNAPLPSDLPPSEMPWTALAGMTDDDLGAIYDFLRTVPPVENKVERYLKWEQ